MKREGGLCIVRGKDIRADEINQGSGFGWVGSKR